MNNFDKVEWEIPDSFSDRSWMHSYTESLVLGFIVKSVPSFNYKNNRRRPKKCTKNKIIIAII